MYSYCYVYSVYVEKDVTIGKGVFKNIFIRFVSNFKLRTRSDIETILQVRDI